MDFGPEKQFIKLPNERQTLTTTFECNPTLSLEKIHHCHLPSSSLGFLWKCHLCSLSGVKLQWKEDFHTQLLMNSLVWVFCLNNHRSKSLHTQNHFCLNKTPTFYVIAPKSFTLCKNFTTKAAFFIYSNWRNSKSKQMPRAQLICVWAFSGCCYYDESQSALQCGLFWKLPLF